MRVLERLKSIRAAVAGLGRRDWLLVAPLLILTFISFSAGLVLGGIVALLISIGVIYLMVAWPVTASREELAEARLEMLGKDPARGRSHMLGEGYRHRGSDR